MHEKIIRFIGTLDEFFKQSQKSMGTAKGFEKLTVSQLRYLETIGVLKSATVSDLAHSMGLSKASVSVAIDKLVTTGFVIKQPSPNDARSVSVALTKIGNQLFLSKTRALQAYGDFVRVSLNKKEAIAFEITLDKLIKKFAAHNIVDPK
jgi:DNA-binding MarR family transcriptional regulator